MSEGLKKNTVLAFFYRGCNQVKFFLVRKRGQI
jgi:hypothetical protein